MNQSEEYLLYKLCNEYNITFSSLIRECAFSNFDKQQIIIRIDDLFEYSKIINNISKAVNQIQITTENNDMYASDIFKITFLFEDINVEYFKNFNKIKNFRNKVEKRIQYELKNPSFKTQENKDEQIVKIAEIRFTPDEKEQLKRIAEEQGVSLSTCLKNNVFRKCGAKRIVIDSYSINKENEELNSKANILAAIADKAKNDFLSQRDIENALLIIEDISEINNKISQIVITDDELKAEVKRLLTERSEQNGSNKD